MSLQKRVRDAIMQALAESGSFGAVYTNLPENYGRAASDGNVAVVEVPAVKQQPRYDSGDETLMSGSDRYTATLIARDADPALRDEAALDLVQALIDAVNGRPLVPESVPDRTFVESATPLPERPPERRYRCVVAVEYLADRFGRSDRP